MTKNIVINVDVLPHSFIMHGYDLNAIRVWTCDYDLIKKVWFVS